MKRDDVHRPSAINPDEYEYVAMEHIEMAPGDFAAAAYMLEQRERLRKHMARTGGNYSAHEHGGNCGICGNVLAIYTALFYHKPTNTYVRAGSNCAEKLHSGMKGAFCKLRDMTIAAREARAGKKKAEGILAAKGLQQAWAIYVAGVGGNPENTIIDIVGKLVKYGSISDKQMSFIGSLLQKIEKRPQIEAQRAAEKALLQPIQEGRYTVEGEILSTKVQESEQWGDTMKMLFKTAAGNTIWTTVPSMYFDDAGNSPLRGCRGVLTVTVTRSKDDPTFGFGKRPSGYLTAVKYTPVPPTPPIKPATCPHCGSVAVPYILGVQDVKTYPCGKCGGMINVFEQAEVVAQKG